MTTLALCAAVMVIAWKMIDRERNPGYICPQCGARDQTGHSKECSWR